MEIDDRGLIYGADRAGGGLHILRDERLARHVLIEVAQLSKSIIVEDVKILIFVWWIVKLYFVLLKSIFSGI